MIVNIDGMDISYKTAGSGKKLLLLHGWGGCGDSFLPTFNYLSQFFQVYAPDFPGHGESSMPPEGGWNVDDYMKITLGFMDAVGIEKADIIAHSFGGRVSILLASKHPERVGKLLLTGSAGLIPQRTLKYYFKVYKFKLLKKLYMTFTFGKNKEEKLERFYKKYGSGDYKNSGALRKTFVKVVNQDLRPYLKDIKAPTLLIWGDKDDAAPYYFGQIMEKEIPDAALITFKDAGHFAYLERNGEFNVIAKKFFEGNE